MFRAARWVVAVLIFRSQPSSADNDTCRFAVQRPFCRRFGEPQNPRQADLSVKLCQLECSQLSSCFGISHDGSDCDLWTFDCDFSGMGTGNYSLMSKACFRDREVHMFPSFGRFSALREIRRIAVVATGGVNDARLNALQLFAKQQRSGIGSSKYLLEFIPYAAEEILRRVQTDRVDALLGPWGSQENLLEQLVDLQQLEVIVAALPTDHSSPRVINIRANLPQHITETLLRSVGMTGLNLAVLSNARFARYCHVAPQVLQDLGISVALNFSIDFAEDADWQGIANSLASDLLLVCLDELGAKRLLTAMQKAGEGGFFPKAMFLPALDLTRSPIEELTWSIGPDCWRESGPLSFRSTYGKAQFVQDYERRFYASPPLEAAEAYAAAELMALALEGTPASVASSVVNTVLGRLDFLSTPLTCSSVQLLPALTAMDPPWAATVGPPELKDRQAVYPAPSWQVRNCTVPFPPLYGWGFHIDQCILCAELLQKSVWSSERQRRECRACAAGEAYVRLSADQGSCFKSCADGQFDSNGTCTSCPSGYFRTQDMPLHRCVACAPGRFSDPAAARCSPCSVGHAAPRLGMHRCQPCQRGFFSAVEGAKSCTPCPQGYFSGAIASSRCEKCPAGTASNVTGSSVCEDCPAGSYSAGLRCALCSSGQYQHLSRQTKCFEDGRGMLSAEPGLVLPSNAKHFFLLRYLNASSEPPVQVERCAPNPKVCLKNETCRDGHSGRQCFTCLPGFVRVTDNSCSRCPSRIYGIFFAVIYFFGYVLAIHLLMILADITNLKDCHLMLLKIMLNHCIAMAVLGSQMWRYVTEAGLFTNNTALKVLMELIVAIDGAPQGEASWFSLSCLMQPPFESIPWIDRLARAKHHEYAQLQSERDELAAYQYLNEVFVVMTWNALPVLVVVVSGIACCIILDRYMRTKMHIWPNALDFYAKVSIFGGAVAHFWQAENRIFYIQLSRKRVLGLFWPLKYANSFARTSWRMLPHRTFLSDHAPARTAVFHLMYFAVARRNLQVFTCEVLGEEDPERVLRKHGAMRCRADHPLVASCIVLAAAWGVVYPLVTMCLLASHVKRGDPQVASPSWAMQVNGYSLWWWEAVIYLRKLGFLLLELVPGSKARILCFTVCCLAALNAQEIYRPFDDRQGDLLNRMERCQLWCILTPSLAMLLALELDDPRTSEPSLWGAMVVLCFVTHIFFIIVWIFHFFQNPLRRTAFWMAQWTPSPDKGWYLRNLILLARSWWESSLNSQPYLAFHSLHGFVTVSGSGGHKALVPYLPQGHELPEVLLNSDEYRLRLSSVPNFLGEVISASTSSRLLVNKDLMLAVKYVVSNCNTFSSSVLDFVLRAAFVLHKELVSAKQARMVATDVARPILDRANEEKNPVLLRDEDEASDSSEDETDAAKELHSKAAGHALEKELREHREMLMEWKGFNDLELLAKELLGKGRGVSAIDLAVEGASGTGEGPSRAQVSAPVDSVKIRLQQSEDVERTYRKKVSAMFSQWTFQHGMTLVDLQQGLALIRQVPPTELQVWLDTFERQWLQELLNSDRVIRRPAILEEEEVQAIKEVIDSAFTGRAVTRRTRIQNVQMKKNWEVSLEKEETKLEVALKWTRLLFWAYCGRFFNFKIAQLKCLTQPHRKQVGFSATLQEAGHQSASKAEAVQAINPEPKQMLSTPAVRHFEVKKSALLASDEARAQFRRNSAQSDDCVKMISL